MTIEETRKQILSSEEFVLSEVKKLQTLYGLKTEIRYALKRDEVIDTESVAEHIYGMHALATYFLPLENPQGDWNVPRIRLLIQLHDIDEIETGDTVGYLKNDTHIKLGQEARKNVIAKLPESMQAGTLATLTEYEAQVTPEARFVKAIDKLEPAIHLYNENGKKIVHLLKTTQAEHRLIKDKYTKAFPYVHRFNLIVDDAMLQEGFFDHSA